MQVNNQLIYESSFTVIKEVLKLPLKVLEDGIDQFCLHLRRDLLKEWEFVFVLQKSYYRYLDLQSDQSRKYRPPKRTFE